MERISISAIRIKHLQSWVDETIELGKGLNVVVAENGVGKSVILKALKVMLTPHRLSREARVDFIREGCPNAEVYLLFSDNSVHKVLIDYSSSYYYYSPDLGNVPLEYIGSNPNKDLLDKVGCIIKDDMISNMISMDETKFLVDSDSHSNRGMLDILINDEDLESVINGIEGRMPECRNMLLEFSSKRSAYSEYLISVPYKDTTVQKENIQYSEKLLNILNAINPSYEKINNTYMYDRNKVSRAKRLVDLLDRVNNIKEAILQINISGDCNLDKIKLILTAVESVNSLMKIKECSPIQNIDKKAIEKKLDLVSNISNISERLSSINIVDKTITEKELSDKLNSIGGETYECPIHGKIKFSDGDCIPCS